MLLLQPGSNVSGARACVFLLVDDPHGVLGVNLAVGHLQVIFVSGNRCFAASLVSGVTSLRLSRMLT